jgi:ribose transport system substrate-binding protein
MGKCLARSGQCASFLLHTPAALRETSAAMIAPRLLLAVALLALVSCREKPAEAPAAGVPRIAVIPKGTTHVFWKSVEAGARKAGQEFGVEILWKGPLKESDRAEQIKIVEQFASEGVSGIVLAPLDDSALRRPVQAAMARKIPVVIFDSALKGEAGADFVNYVGTNNRAGGEIAGRELARLLGGEGKVVLLRYQEGSASTTEREEGFLSVMKQNAGIQMLVDNRFGGATAREAQTVALNLLDVLRQADGIFCSNESLTFGMLLALRQNNLAGKAKFVGFDTSPPLIEALKKGELHALVAQNPAKMGYEAVKTLLAHQRGEKVPPVIDSGAALVTAENLETPEVKALLGQ